ncbi:MAG: hypothetical protein ACSLFI_03670 [Solirubrobacterales bacterium]
MDLGRLIRDVPDFPQPGIVFRDITPLLLEPAASRQVTTDLVHDDLIATGGTAAATIEVVEKLGGKVVGRAFLIELASLGALSRNSAPY